MLINFWTDGPIWMKFSGVGWGQVTFGSVVPLPSPHQVGLGLDASIFPVVFPLHGCWCDWVVWYYFGKHLTSQTTMVEQIFDFGPRPRLVGYDGGLQGGHFWELGIFSYNMASDIKF